MIMMHSTLVQASMTWSRQGHPEVAVWCLHSLASSEEEEVKRRPPRRLRHRRRPKRRWRRPRARRRSRLRCLWRIRSWTKRKTWPSNKCVGYILCGGKAAPGVVLNWLAVSCVVLKIDILRRSYRCSASQCGVCEMWLLRVEWMDVWMDSRDDIY